LREAELAATLSHPHIVGIHDRGEYDGQFWISMDYVAGTDAARFLHENYPGGMPFDEVLPIITAVGSALDYAHYRGLLHRDVKPANILLTEPDGQARRIFLADFGIARQIEDSSKLTATDMTVGTAAYAAPEQLLGQPVDGRADQYALACTAFHLLSGAPPYVGTNPAVVITQHVMAPVPSLGVLRPELRGLDPVLAKAMAKKPADRFDKCEDFAHELHQCLATPPAHVQAAQPGLAPSTLVRTPPQQWTPPPSQIGPPGPPAAPLTAKRRIWRPRLVIPALVAIAVLVAGGVFASVMLFGRHDAAGTSAANPGPFTGTYRADFGPGTSLDGAPVEDAPPITGTWDVRSVCRSSGCVATASSTAIGGTSIVSSLVFDQVGGSWVAVGLGSVPCNDPQAEAWVTYTLQPRPDGTFFGVTARATTNGCASARRTVTFTRIGDADIANAPDPSTLPPRVMSLAAALYGRYHQTMTYTNGASGPEGTDLAAQTYCLRTGDRCISVLHAPSGVVTLVFANGKWTQDSAGATPCKLGGSAQVKVTAEYPLPNPPDDPIQVLTGHGTTLSAENSCVGGDFDVKFERIGD
jgi:serine/threonine-protein kinase